jgi:hypothetical protein
MSNSYDIAALMTKLTAKLAVIITVNVDEIAPYKAEKASLLLGY